MPDTGVPDDESTPAITPELRGDQSQLPGLEAYWEWRGPLPPPAAIKGYNDASPGMGDAILEAFVEEGKHRRQQEALRDRADHELARRGQWLAFGVVIVVIVAAIVLAVTDHEWPAVAVVGIGVTGIVTTFVVGRRPPIHDSGLGPHSERQLEAKGPSEPKE